MRDFLMLSLSLCGRYCSLVTARLVAMMYSGVAFLVRELIG